jgi:hypothetical protein
MLTARLRKGGSGDECSALRPHDFDIDTLFWGELIFLALFVSSFLLWKAIEGRGNRTTLNGVAMREDSSADFRVVGLGQPLESGTSD